MKSARAVRRRRRAAFALAVATGTSVGALALAVPAQAQSNATATVGSGALTYQAGVGQTNIVTVDKVLVATGTQLSVRIRIDDIVAITPGAGCSPVIGDATRVTCSLTNLVVVHADDRNDQVTVNAPIQSILYGDAGSDILRSGPTSSSVQNLIYGGAGNDVLAGGSGRDVLVGGAGADDLSGGGGVDTASYTDHSTPVFVDSDGVTGDDGAAGEADSVRSDVENLWGGSAGDFLVGNAAANQLLGLNGPDYLNGGLGADTMNGGTGVDTVDYSGHSTAVTADLDPTTPDGSTGEGDMISNVENLWGGSGNDVLIGNNGDNSLAGWAGNDWLVGQDGFDRLDGSSGDDVLVGGGGNDLLDGGYGKDTMIGNTGEDTVTYSARTAGVTVRLDQSGNDDGNANDGPAGARDNVDASVEDVDGGRGSDVIVGTAGANVIHGNGGVDYLYGGDGADFIYGGAQFDYLYGQSGFDLCDVGNHLLSDPVEGTSLGCEEAQPPPP